MATYSYVLCSKCGGTGHASGTRCSRCEGARMTGSLVDERILQLLEVEGSDFAPTSSPEMLTLHAG